MRKVKSRDIIDTKFLGETISFVASNDRIKERVTNISHEDYMIKSIIERARPDDVFWDVGACMGIHSFIVSQFLPDGDVVAFEPMPSNRGVLVDNKSLNHCDNVTVFREALADESGEREFAIRESVQPGYGRHSFVKGDYDSVKTISVDVESGDGLLVKDSTVPRPNIIKVDVEGAGPLVMNGLQHILSSDECHTVVFETHRPNDTQPSHEDFGYTEDEFISLVEDCGFNVKTLNTDYHYIGFKDVEHMGSITTEKASVSVEKGDISEKEADVLVNSAGTTLMMGTGVAGALLEKGGDRLNEAAILQGPIDEGSAVITPAFELDAKFVIHAASMPHYGDGNSTAESIKNSVTRSFEIAENENVNSIVLPLVGCGFGGVPIVTGARVIRDVINKFDFQSIEDVTVMGYTDDEYDVINKIFNSD
jgi:FkbM family methyltransferase